MCEWDIDRGTYCPELWAQDSNAIVCDYAYGRWVNGTDLLTSGYAAGAFHIVENQLAKAAWRLSGWLNTIGLVFYDDSAVEDCELPGMVRTGRASFRELPGQIALGKDRK